MSVDIESFKAQLTEERVDFQFWEVDQNGERHLLEMVFVPSREVVLARRAANRLK
jgi:c-di-GMP-binding flagellar brake protein YcgR